MSESGTLHIHTRMTAGDSEAPVKPIQRKKPRGWRRHRSERQRLDFGDRLLRNSAIACAALLGILALGNIQQPWAVKASEGIERALSMRVDLDDTIGELKFVRDIMPESALVFLNVSGTATPRPSDGEVAHRWSNLQPWTLFDGENRPATAIDAGTVTAISTLSGGGYGVLVDHGEGVESLYANLNEVNVETGESVSAGQRLGVAGDGLYFELRQDGQSVDPSERLGL